ncbi:MAG TPA: VOC family protein [Azospirillum sp.]|nr:VOC family protein [Azospirillum sp.]
MSSTTAEARKAVKHALSPHLVVDGAAKAIDFYKEAFGAEEMIRLPGKDGKLLHAAVSINGAVVMLVDEMHDCGMLGPKSLKGTPVTLTLDVEDVDHFVERAVKAGATLTMPVADMFWGDRYGVIEDPFGHRWAILTHQRDMTEAELKEAAKQAMGT